MDTKTSNNSPEGESREKDVWKTNAEQYTMRAPGKGTSGELEH